MSREAFARVWKVWLDVVAQACQHQAIYIYGSRGYGKSHIFATLTCLLVCSSTRVIYIPDCHAMMHDLLQYLQVAFLFTFADPASSTQQENIHQCKAVNNLISFAQWYKTHGRLCFIIDQ